MTRFFTCLLLTSLCFLKSLSQTSTGIFYNVKDSGAKGDGITDDTVAIQSAITTATNGGVVYFPEGTYIVGGALQSINGLSTQLILPCPSGTGETSVTLCGPIQPPQIQNPGSNAFPVKAYGAIIKSTLATGTGCLLGTKGANYSGASQINLTLANLRFVMPSNTVNTCLDLTYCGSVRMQNVLVDAGEWSGNTILQPTTATSYGLKTPADYFPEVTILDRVSVVGFYTGVKWGELVNADNLNVWMCNVGVEVGTGTHCSLGRRLLMIHCPTNFLFSGANYIDLQQVDLEETHDAGNWQAMQYGVLDNNNYGRGNIVWHAVTSGDGRDSSFPVSGGGNLAISELGILSTTTWTATGTNWTLILNGGRVQSLTHSP